MRFFKKIGKVVKSITKRVGNIFKPLHDRLKDPLGLGNIPQSFSLNHNINLNGKIDVSVNVKSDVNVDVKIDLSDAIAAASLIKDGLAQFDIFGGALRQIINNYEQALEERSLLHELQRIVKKGSSEQRDDEFYFEVSLINDSTIIKELNGVKQGYQITRPCGLTFNILINNELIANETALVIEKEVEKITSESLHLERLISATNIRNDNVVKLSANYYPYLPDEATKQAWLKDCRLQIKLIRETQNWRYTVIEWIFDGNSGPSAVEARFLVNHPQWTATPSLSQEAKSLEKKIEILSDELTFPKVDKVHDLIETKSNDSFGRLSMAEWIHSTIIKTSESRIHASKELEELLNKLDTKDPNSFDVRVPFTAALSCHKGSIKLKLESGFSANNSDVIDKEIELNEGDEIAIRVPFLAGQTVPRGSILNQQIQFTISSDEDGAYCTASVYAGFEWASEIVSTRSIRPKANEETIYTVPITLSDSLAD